MKIVGAVCISILLLLGFSACKKESKIEDPNGCLKYSTDAPVVFLSGVDSAGVVADLVIDTAKYDTSFKFYWQLPDGSVHAGARYKMGQLAQKNAGTYYGYYQTPEGCSSSKAALQVNAVGLGLADVPCSLPANYFDITNIKGYEKVTTKPADGVSSSWYHIYGGTDSFGTFIHIQLSRYQIEPGIYKIMYYPFPSDYSNFGKRYAFLECTLPGPKNPWINTTDNLYIVRNNDHFEVIVCGIQMHPVTLTNTETMSMRLAIK